MYQKRNIAVLLSALLLVGCSNQTAHENPVSVQKNTPAVEDDFYAGINADFFRDAALLYGDNTLSYADAQVYDLICDCVSDASAKGYRADIRTLYTQYTDTAKRDADGIAILQKGLDAAANAQTVDEYLSALALLYCEYGCEVLLRPYFVQDAYDSSAYVCQLGDISFGYRPKQAVLGSDNLILSEQRAVEIILPMLVYTENEAAELYAQICLMLLDIAEQSMDNIERISVESTYHPYDMSALNALYGGADIAGALSAFGISEPDVIVFDEGNAAAVGSYLTAEHLPMLRAYAQLCLINTYAKYLPQQYEDASVLLGAGKTSGEEEAAYMVVDLLKEELDVLYYETYCDTASQKAVTKLCEDIRNAYKAQIRANTYLSDDGKKRILQKLEQMAFLIGGTAKCDAVYEISSARGFLENAVQIRCANAARNLKKANETPNRTKWDAQNIPSYENNGLYDRSRNNVTITAAAIQAEYAPDASDAKNLGTIGFYIAHEISHAFDANCILYDAAGTYNPDALPETDLAFYKAMQDKVEAYYSAQTIVGLYQVDGKTTLSENIADIAGLQCLVSMLDNNDDRRVLFASYAQSLRTVASIADAVDALAQDEHAPQEIRCNAVLSLTDAFYEVYDISEGDGMYLAPADRIRIW